MKDKVLVPKNNKDHIILAIETSCDETSVAVIRGSREVLSNIVSSQIDIHKKYGGVVPEIASRHHLDNINMIIKEAMDTAGITFEEIDLIGVTCGPGLVGALLIGIAAAKALSYVLKVPIVGVHHIEGHICANYLEHADLKPPFLGLVVSGGHTHILDVLDYNNYNILGRTRDDAVGEAFDKVARVIGLGYPGGPLIDRLALSGDPEAISFPRIYLEHDSFDFSFSGIKTAVLNYINSEKQKNNAINKADVAASFQKAVMDVIIEKTCKAAKKAERDTVVVAGGVAANSFLRKMLKEKCGEMGIRVFFPSLDLCTDNAAMIGCAAYHNYMAGKVDNLYLDANPNLKL